MGLMWILFAMDNNYFWSYSFPMKKGMWDNDYYFYEDGKILHFFDRHHKSLNNEEFVKADSITLEDRKTMLAACPARFQEIIKKILDL